MGWQLIQSQSLSASAASVTFSSIPQTYKTLKLVSSTRSDVTNGSWLNADATISINGSSANISARTLIGDWANAQSNTSAGFLTESSVATASTFNSAELTFPNYTSSVANKPFSVENVIESNASGPTGGWYIRMSGMLNSSTSPITSLSVGFSSGNFVFGSTFTLYGLL